MNEKQNVLCTIILPVWNACEYLEEAIESVLDQSIGTDGIQLILVNDGSTDGSGSICERFAVEHPDCVEYYTQEHKGTAAARNLGLLHASGRYISFLGAEDQWDRDAFRQILSFLEENPEIGIATPRIRMIGDAKRHSMDYKYWKTRIIDVYEIFYYPEQYVNKTFFRNDTISGRQFDETLSVGGDLAFMTSVLLDVGRYALIREAEYLRREDDYAALPEGKTMPLNWYTEAPDRVFQYVIDRSVEKAGTVTMYIQYLLITELQRLLDRPLPVSLSPEQKSKCFDDLMRILSCIGDRFILKQNLMSVPYRSYVLHLKHRESYSENISTLNALAKQIRMNAAILNTTGNKLLIEGFAVEKAIDKGCGIYAENSSGKRFPASYRVYPRLDQNGIDESVTVPGYFHSLELPLEDKTEYRFYVVLKDGTSQRLKLSFGKFSRLTSLEHSFFSNGHWILYTGEDSICVEAYTEDRYREREKHFNQTIREKAPDDAESIIRVREESMRLRKEAARPIWVLSDRTEAAGDNAEALFRYLMRMGRNKRYATYFVLESDCADFPRISEIGPVVPCGSESHLVTQLAASMIISSAADDRVFTPYGADHIYYQDLIDSRYVFLQHGITVDPIWRWMNRLSKNAVMVCAAARSEYQLMKDPGHGFDDDVVRLTGFARYDRLWNWKKRVIAIMPKWRQEYALPLVPGTSRREYDPSFKETPYYRFYERLINDPDLINAMRQHGYKGIFYMHPSFREQAKDFHGNDVISVWDDIIPYSKVFRESSLLITDYSSVSIDFAYLKKPVVYTQFDREVFYKHSARGFDYEKDGFGPVYTTYEETVPGIIEIINRNCRNTTEYLRRIDAFFAYTDHGNCRRIFRELDTIEKNRRL